VVGSEIAKQHIVQIGPAWDSLEPGIREFRMRREKTVNPLRSNKVFQNRMVVRSSCRTLQFDMVRNEHLVDEGGDGYCRSIRGAVARNE
jgi:hypothetical protein